jgi:hypothetical protein
MISCKNFWRRHERDFAREYFLNPSKRDEPSGFLLGPPTKNGVSVSRASDASTEPTEHLLDCTHPHLLRETLPFQIVSVVGFRFVDPSQLDMPCGMFFIPNGAIVQISLQSMNRLEI